MFKCFFFFFFTGEHSFFQNTNLNTFLHCLLLACYKISYGHNFYALTAQVNGTLFHKEVVFFKSVSETRSTKCPQEQTLKLNLLLYIFLLPF